MVRPRLILALSFFAGALVSAPTDLSPWPLPPNAWFLARIPPPFTVGSDGDRADLDYSRNAQAAATPEQVAHANATSRFTVFSFADVLGPGFTPADYPETALFFVRLADTANGPKNFLKDTFRRERPFRGHPEAIRRLVPDEDGFSYPSGHSTRSRLFARVLGELDPAKMDAFLKCGDEIANDRIIGGMHYRSDVLASWKLGDLLFAELMKDPGFVKDLAGLKNSEWSRQQPATGDRKCPAPQRPEESAAIPSAESSGTK